MPTINSENAKNIRTPFEVHCGLSKLTDEVLSFSGSGAKVMPSMPLQPCRCRRVLPPLTTWAW